MREVTNRKDKYIIDYIIKNSRKKGKHTRV